MKDTKVSKLDALNMLLGRYQSQRRLEEAVIVRKIIEREKTTLEEWYSLIRARMHIMIGSWILQANF